MIVLRPMREDEYAGYLEYFIADYAREIAANYRLSMDESLLRVKREIAKDLPEGVNTPGQTLLSLFEQSADSDRPVGYLWYQPDTAMRTVFIYDFHILNPYQGQGLGKQALRTFEKEMQNKGFEQIRLRVAGDNDRARHVYEIMGFGVTGINMSKTIKN